MKEAEVVKKFDTWEQLIRDGQGAIARREIVEVSHKKISRPNLGRYANLCRRVGLPSLAVQALHSLIRPECANQLPANEIEKAEYAASLVDIGAIDEAQQMFEEMEPTALDPRCLLFYSFSLFRNWQYREAIPKLQRYLNIVSDPYQKFVGEVNLAAALVSTGLVTEAKELISRLLVEAATKKFTLLQGNLLELSAQVEIAGKNYSRATELLNESTETLKATGSIGVLYARKWQLIIEARKAKNLHEAFMPFNSLMQEARFRREWETLRDIDRQLGKMFQDEFLAAKLVFGSPFTNYRDNIRKEFSKTKLPKEFFLTNRWQWQSNGKIFEVETGKLEGKDIDIKPGALMHRLVATLTSDFYRPFRVGAMFAKLFPDEYYNPFTAYDRIYQCVKRVRKVFEDNNLPIEVRQTKYEYYLKVAGPASIKIPANFLEKKSNELKDSYYLTIIRDLGKGSEFSAKEMGEALKISTRTVNRIIKENIDSGALVKVGDGRKTRYRLSG